jgi:hypothetical protein
MAEQTGKTSVMRVSELGRREATVLEHGDIRVMIDDQGGMIPEFSCIGGNHRINAHWLPWFRANSGRAYKDADHGSFWKANLLYHLAGSFPCIPNFGPGHIIDGVNMPVHGWTANLSWKFLDSGVHEESGGAWALSAMEGPDKAMPLSFRKIDAILPDQAVHYAAIRVQNKGDRDIEICAGWHNTLGAPFLHPGCRISGAAKTWTTPPLGGEFDTTTRLVLGREFDSLEGAPLAQGGKVDISQVPGLLGFTDFVTGVIPPSAKLGWSALVNPALKLAYVCFFTGPGSAAEDDIILRFNDLWMQYGGRPFTPWAPYEGGTDLAYCLGTENAAAAYAYGLEYSRQVKQVLDAPATVLIPAHGARTLRYGVLFAPYEGAVLDQGIRTVEAGDGRTGRAEGKSGGAGGSHLICSGTKEFWSFAADPAFTVLKQIEARYLGVQPRDTHR